MLSYTSSLEDFLAASDEEVIQYCDNAPFLGPSNLRRLSAHLICKIRFDVGSNEFYNQKYAWEQLNGDKLRIPRPYRLVQHGDEGTVYLLMEFIEGSTLEQQYREDDAFIDQVVAAILFMQERCSNIYRQPGPVLGGFAKGFPWGLYEVESEFASVAALEACANRRLATTKQGTLLKLQNRPCTLVHGDVVTRNIILTPQGQIVLVDWETACFYPPIFEAAALYFHWSVASHEQRGFFDKVIARLTKHYNESDESLHLIERVHIVSLQRLFKST